MPENYGEALSKVTGVPVEPMQALMRIMHCMEGIRDDISAIRVVMEGDDDNVGVAEVLTDQSYIFEAVDGAMMEIMSESKRFSPSEFHRNYAQIRTAQESDKEEEDEPKQLTG